MDALENFAQIKQNVENKSIYDIEINRLDLLRNYSSIELHFIVYPYSRDINSDHINFYPFEEYIKDINSNLQTAYTKIETSFHKLFGMFLGGVIALIFYIWNPADLFSVESIVAVFAAYSLGKEIWGDIEKALFKFTRNGIIRFQESYYKYELEKFSTLTNYSSLAKKTRYGKEHLPAEKIHFLQMSNSQTLRLYFDKESLNAVTSNSVHLFSMRIDHDKNNAFLNKGFLFGLKVSLNKKFLGITRSEEIFQSIHKYSVGCLDSKGVWNVGNVFFRKVISVAKLRLLYKTGIQKNKEILQFIQSKKVIDKKRKK